MVMAPIQIPNATYGPAPFGKSVRENGARASGGYSSGSARNGGEPNQKARAYCSYSITSPAFALKTWVSANHEAIIAARSMPIPGNESHRIIFSRTIASQSLPAPEHGVSRVQALGRTRKQSRSRRLWQ